MVQILGIWLQVSRPRSIGPGPLMLFGLQVTSAGPARTSARSRAHRGRSGSVRIAETRRNDARRPPARIAAFEGDRPGCVYAWLCTLATAGGLACGRACWAVGQVGNRPTLVNGCPQRIGDHRGHADRQADSRPLGPGFASLRVAVSGETGVALSGRQIPEHVYGSGSSVLAEPPGGTRGKVT
jgi:hypothetical protein